MVQSFREPDGAVEKESDGERERCVEAEERQYACDDDDSCRKLLHHLFLHASPSIFRVIVGVAFERQ